MTARPIRIPDARHPITTQHNPKRVVVKLAGLELADTRDAITLQEASYPAVQYIPRKDVAMGLLKRSDHATYCPYKGDASYFHLSTPDATLENAVWTYESPSDAVSVIKDHVAFYPNLVEISELSENAGARS